MKFKHILAAALLASAAGAVAQGGQTAQAAYDAGQTAFDAGRWADAAAAYATALRMMSATSASVPVIRARRATALLNLRRIDDARSEARGAVARFGALGVAKSEDLAAALAVLGQIARFELDEPAAIAAFTQALAAADGPNREGQVTEARVGLALAAMTSDPARAVAALDPLLVDPGFAALPKPRQADLLALRGRAALNAGDARGAATFIERAFRLVGSTTTRINLAQARMRGDAALIYARLNDPEKVRLYLTYSGAGHLPDQGRLSWGDNPLPVCGAEVRPDDVAVVEFAIGDNGRAIGAAPIWASRPGPIGAIFARAVRDWRWTPATVRKLEPFWRSSIRIELRCVTRPPGVDLVDEFREATEAWAAAHDVTVDLTDPALKPADVAGNPAPAARVIQLWLDATRAERRPDWTGLSARMAGALDAANAPASVRAFVLLPFTADGRAQGGRASRATLIAALERRADGGRSAAWLRTERAIDLERDRDWAAARTELTAVTALSAATLPADDPVRTVAVLHQSMIDRRLGQGVAADRRLAAAGIDAESCSILNVQPLATNMAVSSQTFPEEAQRWRFEGTVREAFDINADGSVASVRTVIAYPPLVFGPATERAVQRFRYMVPTLGDRPLGCAGQTVNVRYVLPN